MKLRYKPTMNVFELPEAECERILSENFVDYELLDGKVKIKTKKEKGSVVDKILDNNPYLKMKQAELDAELTKRGIDFKALKVKSNADKAELLIKDDEKKAKQAKFEALKAEAADLEVEIAEDDTLETLQVKVDTKKAGSSDFNAA